MTVIVEPAPAKINLALHVRRRRDDGYHELETLFAFCRDGDVVTVERAGATSLTLTGPFAKILAGEVQDDNLVMRAARGFVARFGVEGDHAVLLPAHPHGRDGARLEPRLLQCGLHGDPNALQPRRRILLDP